MKTGYKAVIPITIGVNGEDMLNALFVARKASKDIKKIINEKYPVFMWDKEDASISGMMLEDLEVIK